MSLGWPIHAVRSKREFWRDYFWQKDAAPPSEGYLELVNEEEPVTEAQAAQLEQYNVQRSKWLHCRLDAPLGEYGLRLQFDPQINQVNLSLLGRSGDEMGLGWDDQAQWHPHVLRCEELDLICRCIARQDATLPHPGLPLLLICRFAPVTDSEDSVKALSMLYEAWHSLRLFSNEQIGKFMRMVDFRGTGVEWRQDKQQRWTLHLDRKLHPGIGLYTLRCPENPEFPSAELAAAMANARRIVDDG